MNNNSYKDDNLKYPLTNDEIKLIDEVWKFINIFRKSAISRSIYRRTIIDKIKKKYNVDEFYKLEKIVEKMYWNLFYKLSREIDLNPKIYIKEEFDLKDMTNKILMRNNNITQSNIKKTYIVTKNNKMIYKYDYPNEIDLLIYSIMINRGVYESIMTNTSSIFEIDILPYSSNIEFDYPYPNFNTIKGFTTNNNERKSKIQKMYYDINSEKNWFI